MAKRAYHEILEVAADATPAEIRAAYRRLIRRYHPDLNPDQPDAEARTRELNEAYRALLDMAARRSQSVRIPVVPSSARRVWVSPPQPIDPWVMTAELAWLNEWLAINRWIDRDLARFARLITLLWE